MPMTPSRKGRFVRKLATAAVRALYRRVDVYRGSEPLTAGPELTVANHFGGFADPLLLLAVLPRPAAILARDLIWRIPVVGWIMNRLGAIKVHKPEDGGGSNDEMFADAHAALAEGRHVMIFPEGVTRDDPSIAAIKTGAARIVLGARTRGTAGIAVTPAGIHYEDKAALRSSVSIHVGRPLWLDGSAPALGGGPGDADDREAVRRLTDEIETRLRRVAPDFVDWHEARALTDAAEMVLRSLQPDPARPVPIAQRDVVAGHLGRRPPGRRAEVLEAVDAYERDLEAVGLTDAQLLAGVSGTRFLWSLLGWLVLTLVLAPFALIGLAVNLVPGLIVRAVGLVRAAPAMMATLKPMAAIVAFGITWGLVVWQAVARLGPAGGAAIALLLPVYGWTLIFVSEHAALLWRAFRSWRGTRSPGELRDVLADDRSRVVAAVREAM
jgi:glycerol-3-phosphate O-acyltransferase / dihydroxyacetone phosphate acyltransferase